MDLRYVLDNEKSRHQCPHCLAIWFEFDDQGRSGVYRLGQLPPSDCMTCDGLDRKIEANPDFIVSAERWFDL